jgi:uncharacterized protein (TIGR02145 family)
MRHVLWIAAKSERRVRTLLACCMAVLMSTSANLAAQTEDVSAVEAVQVGSRIEIRYTLTRATDVTLYLSEDGGVKWAPLTSCLNGDFGANVAAGRRTAVWDVLSCRESLVGGTIRFKVRAGKPGPCSGAEVILFDGYDYPTVAIGTQCWFKENLRSDNYRNGDAIPGNLSDAQWTSTTSGAQTVYGEGSSAVIDGSSDEVANLATYGRLYNWYAVNDSRGLCPSGFHVPSDGEWMTLEMALGMTSSQANSTGWRGTDQGTQKKTSSWRGTNSSGFSALPGGYRRSDNGHFDSQGNGGYWWSSSPGGTNAWARSLGSASSSVYRDYASARNGISVRCVRD